jgi:hypothetical protein
VLDYAGLAAHPQLWANGYLQEIETPNLGTMRVPGPAVRMSATPTRVQGGFMSLTGRMLNTNPNAQIRVMDGYGQITIQNDLDIPLQINRLDTGNPGALNNGIEGKLIITDMGQKNGAGAPLVTEYTRLGSDIAKKE